MFGLKHIPYNSDRSARTLSARTAYIVFVTACLMLLVSIVGYMMGSGKYNRILAQSSTPVGSAMTFARSQSNCTLSGLYTDKTDSVLIARISFDTDQDSLNVPYKGSDYTTIVSSKAIPSSVQQMDVLTGRLSTDGDLFVVIPKPDKKAVYSVFVVNNNYIGTTASTSTGTQDNTIDLSGDSTTKQSLTSALSQYKYNKDVNKIQDTYTVANDDMDVIGFRVTLSPALDDDAYKPIVLDTQLLDASNAFDFKAFFQTVFVDNAEASLTDQFKQYQVQENSLSKQVKEFNDRIAANPDDTAASEQLQKVNTQLEQVQKSEQNVADKLEIYDSLTYNDNLFSNLSTKAWVI